MITQFLLLVNAILYLVPNLLDGSLDPTGKSGYFTKLMEWGSFRNLAFENGDFYRLITSMFLHWNLLHFAVNMYSLYNLGPSVERTFGNMRMLIIYIAAGISGGVFTYFFGQLLGQNPSAPSAGASGAIFGLVGVLIMYAYLNPQYFAAGALQQLIIVGAINIFLGFMPGSNIGNAAHIGGLVAGLAIGFVFGR